MKYSPDKVAEICKTLETGMTIDDTCILCGISDSVFYEWIKERPDFADSVKRAQARNKQRSAVIIQKAANTSWQAAAWWLERKYRDEYAKREEVTGAGGSGLFEKIEFSTKDKKTEEE